jgi:hypothetical protein
MFVDIREYISNSASNQGYCGGLINTKYIESFEFRDDELNHDYCVLNMVTGHQFELSICKEEADKLLEKLNK